MLYPRLLPVLLLVAGACGSSSHADGDGSVGGTFACMDCLTDSDCAGGGLCVQFGADTACAPACDGPSCGGGAVCQPLTNPEGQQVSACVPAGETCGMSAPIDAAAGSSDAGACGSLVPPSSSGCCQSCTPGSGNCQPNGCYGGWWCNTATCYCQSPPTSCGGGGGNDAVNVGDPPSGSVTTSGGTVSRLYFAVVGDTRPALSNDTANYPTAVITKIYSDLEQLSPRPELAIATGDYQFASTSGSDAGLQVGKYMTAKAGFSNPSFFVMGNHECTGYTRSNCVAGQDGTNTANYRAFMDQMMRDIGQTEPYYSIRVDATDGSWTSKFVFIAANAWDATQSTWLAQQLAVPTTYTFIVRHEPSSATTAPGVTPSDSIIAQHPYTLLIAGHTHRYYHNSSGHEVVIGLGGAPITSSDDFGYLIVSQASDGTLVVSEYDYMTGMANDTFVIKADGNPGP